jgi:hypothetical protein
LERNWEQRNKGNTSKLRVLLRLLVEISSVLPQQLRRQSQLVALAKKESLLAMARHHNSFPLVKQLEMRWLGMYSFAKHFGSLGLVLVVNS